MAVREQDFVEGPDGVEHVALEDRAIPISSPHASAEKLGLLAYPTRDYRPEDVQAVLRAVTGRERILERHRQIAKLGRVQNAVSAAVQKLIAGFPNVGDQQLMHEFTEDDVDAILDANDTHGTNGGRRANIFSLATEWAISHATFEDVRRLLHLPEVEQLEDTREAFMSVHRDGSLVLGSAMAAEEGVPYGDIRVLRELALPSHFEGRENGRPFLGEVDRFVTGSHLYLTIGVHTETRADNIVTIPDDRNFPPARVFAIMEAMMKANRAPLPKNAIREQAVNVAA